MGRKIVTVWCGQCSCQPVATEGVVGPGEDPCEVCKANQPKQSSRRPHPDGGGKPRPMGRAWLSPRLKSVAEYKAAVAHQRLGGEIVRVRACAVNAASGVKCDNGGEDEVVTLTEGEVRFEVRIGKMQWRGTATLCRGVVVRIS
jgi:hypothetical protein